VKGFHRDPTDTQRWQSYIDPTRKIVYLRLTQFTPNCSAEVAEALRQAGADKGDVKGLILDLRWNGGGVLQDAVAIADMFLKEGVIVSTKGRSHPEEVARAVEPGTLPDFPIAILVNAQSASASEVLAGALAENGRAIVVGTRTFGKGLVQTVRTLPNSGGAQLKITEQAYYLPSGRSLHRKGDSAEWGVDPTDGFYLPITDEEVFEIFTVRRQEDILRAGASESEAEWADAATIIEKLKDRQLAATLQAMQAKVDSGAWATTGGPLPERGAQSGEELARLLRTRERVERELIRMDERIESLQTASGKPAELPDLWSDEIDPTGGRVVVLDKDGKQITELKITGPNIERALQSADIAKPEAGATESESE
jgi:carboxyl-terminal processing protease